LLAVAPLAVAMLGIALAVRFQATALVGHERALVEAAYLQSKETELRHYVELAQSAIAPMVKSGRTDEATRQAAMDALARLDYGRTAISSCMTCRAQPDASAPARTGGPGPVADARPEGALTIQKLVAAAKAAAARCATVAEAVLAAGGAQARLRGGRAGLELDARHRHLSDDVEQTLRQLDARAETDIRETMAWIGVIAAISILLVAASGLALNVSEHREADAKLRQLAQRVVQSQEEERARLSRELHDGISQLLVSVKLVLEAAPTASAWPDRSASVAPILGMALNRLDSAFNEVRRVARNLRPPCSTTWACTPRFSIWRARCRPAAR
jgi:two-component system NarL family sensor kinase